MQILKAYAIEEPRRISASMPDHAWRMWEVNFTGQTKWTRQNALPDRQMRRTFETEAGARAFVGKLRALNRKRRRRRAA